MRKEEDRDFLSCRGCECEHLGPAQRRKTTQQTGQGVLALPPKCGTSQGPHLLWSPQVCSLHRTKMIFLKYRFYTMVLNLPSRFSVSGWLCELQVPGRVNKFLALAELFPAASLDTLFPCGRAVATPAFFQSFADSCFPAAGPLHLLSSLAPPPPLPSLIFELLLWRSSPWPYPLLHTFRWFRTLPWESL